MSNQIEILFSSDKSLDQMASLLGDKFQWVKRGFRGNRLVSTGDSDVRVRVHEGLTAGRFGVLAWCQSDANDKTLRKLIDKNVLGPIKADKLTPLSAGFITGRECAVFTFSSDLGDLGDAANKLREARSHDWVVDGDSLRAVSLTRDPPEEVRWRIANTGGGWVMEVTYDATNHDETSWRKTYQTARELPASQLSAADISEPDAWDIAIPEYREHKAWSFNADGSIDELREPLSKAWAHPWRKTDKAWTRDYLESVVIGPYAQVTKLRLMEDQGKLIVKLQIQSDHSAISE